ncbi:phosphodiester glycosidase family protein [Streptomyces sp. NPDC050516]|uniref:phosphodiester glycosidase family protein n=1 Tax=Streptomyces sp. NPDC050516 TaxID=3365621 RepID=UPI00379B6FD6
MKRLKSSVAVLVFAVVGAASSWTSASASAQVSVRAAAVPAAAAAVSEVVAPGVGYRAFTVRTSHGSARVHVLTVDLGRRGVQAGLLYAGGVAAREKVSVMAARQGAVAGVNGDFFDIEESQHPGVQATGATSGPAVRAGRPLKAAVPDGQRFGWPLPRGGSTEDVFGVGVDGIARTGRLTLQGHIRTAAHGTLPLRGLNQYALPVGSIGVFTPRWGATSRARAVCGTDDVRAAPCTRDAYEVTVRRGVVRSVSSTPGSGRIPEGSVVLLGREAGAKALRALKPGTAVKVDYRLASSGRAPFAFALGAHPIVVSGRPFPGLDTVVAEPRSAIGIARGGHVMRLLSTDGREGTSSGLTVSELARLLATLECDAGAYLDGGGSATLATRDHTGHLVVRNALDHGEERAVSNGVAVYSR